MLLTKNFGSGELFEFVEVKCKNCGFTSMIELEVWNCATCFCVLCKEKIETED